MPKIPTGHREFAKQVVTRSGEEEYPRTRVIEQPHVGEEIKQGDRIMILIREFFVRDNHEGNPVWGDTPAEINLSFSIQTGGHKYDVSLGTFSGITDRTAVNIQDMIVIPLTEIKDYLVLTVNAIEENDLKKGLENVGKTITFVENVLGKVPGAGTVASPVVNLAGQLINLIAALSPEDVLIRESATYFVDSEVYGHVSDVKFLTTGFIYIYEDGFEFDGREFRDRSGAKAEPTRILLEIIKPRVNQA